MKNKKGLTKMSIYAIADLHLSFNHPKPMDIFGDNWENHTEKLKRDWLLKVKENDTVIIPGDFSWETYLEDAYQDFNFLNSLPGKKILLKGNHDYWWTTLTNIRKFLKDNHFDTIEILFNNSYEIEDYIVAGARGWDYAQSGDRKIIEREIGRLELSLKDAKKRNPQKEIIVCMHYPPISKKHIENEFERKIIFLLQEYNVKKCFYGHLHGTAHNEAVMGIKEGIDFQLVSADYLDFKLFPVKE